MAPGKIPQQSSELAHELRKVNVLTSYAQWCETHISEADAQDVRAAIQRVVLRADRAIFG